MFLNKPKFDFAKTKHVFEKKKGQNQNITKFQSEDEFPEELSNYIKFLEKELEVPISIVSVGPNRAETIVR